MMMFFININGAQLSADEKFWSGDFNGVTVELHVRDALVLSGLIEQLRKAYSK